MTNNQNPARQTNVEPLGYISAYGLEKLQTRRHYCVSVSHQAETEYVIPIFREAPPPSPKAEEEHRCPKCDEAFKLDDNCATDIELGTCHFECLDGSPVVDLETGDELPDEDMHSFPYSDVMDPPPPSHSEDTAEIFEAMWKNHRDELLDRIAKLEAALQEQVDACDADDCEMCHRHRAMLATTEGQS